MEQTNNNRQKIAAVVGIFLVAGVAFYLWGIQKEVAGLKGQVAELQGLKQVADLATVKSNLTQIVGALNAQGTQLQQVVDFINQSIAAQQQKK